MAESRSSLSADTLLAAYRRGVFPMAHPEKGNAIYWHAPDPRAILPIEDFHVPSNLARKVRARRFRITTDCAFRDVIEACAARETTWISDEIIRVYDELHNRGYAHSVEAWENEALAGGLYGVAIGSVFFGESMFFRVSNASKVALVHLAGLLDQAGFMLHDIQYMTEHLEQFGAHEIPSDQFQYRLRRALNRNAGWPEPEDIPDLVTT